MLTEDDPRPVERHLRIVGSQIDVQHLGQCPGQFASRGTATDDAEVQGALVHARRLFINRFKEIQDVFTEIQRVGQGVEWQCMLGGARHTMKTDHHPDLPPNSGAASRERIWQCDAAHVVGTRITYPPTPEDSAPNG